MRQGQRLENSAQSKTPSMLENSMRESRETSSPSATQLVVDRLEKAMSQESSRHGGGESDVRVVPTKRLNKSGEPPAEGVEGRRATKEDSGPTIAPRTQSRIGASSGLSGVREVAGKTCASTPDIRGRSRVR